MTSNHRQVLPARTPYQLRDIRAASLRSHLSSLTYLITVVPAEKKQRRGVICRCQCRCCIPHPPKRNECTPCLHNVRLLSPPSAVVQVRANNKTLSRFMFRRNFGIIGRGSEASGHWSPDGIAEGL